MVKVIAAVSILVVLAGCQAGPSVRDGEICVIPSIETSDEALAADRQYSAKPLRWYRLSAERAMAYAQTYRAACERVVERSATLKGTTWGVVLDADETVLDNSVFQARIEADGITFDDREEFDRRWQEWVGERSAPLLPGAKHFVDVVRGVGGRVFIVTNRLESQCDDTRANLADKGLIVNQVMCQEGGESDKNPRFERVRAGGRVTIVGFVGDNILDFPEASQTTRDSSRFGVDYFVLPNPMYGSFERLRAR